MKILKIILICFCFEYNLLAKDNVYIFMSSDCPVCISQTKDINEIYNLYKNIIDFVLVFPNMDTSEESIIEFNKTYKIEIPYLIDSTQSICKNYKITTIPEVIVEKDSKIVYRGRIDNSYFAPGRKRTLTTEFDLKNILNELLSNKLIIKKETKPIGCVLTYKKDPK